MAPLSQGLIFTKEMLKMKTPISAASRTVTRLLSSTTYDDSPSSYNRQQNLPEPKPNRPLRGERPFNPSREAPRFRHQAPPPSNDRQTIVDKPYRTQDAAFDARNRSESQFDRSFLEKFKLGLDQTKETSPQPEQQPRASEPLPPPEDADEIFKKMKETGLIPNAVAMLDGLCKDGLVQEAMKLFGLMREKGTIPEVVIYTAVVEGFCKAHKFDDAKRIFWKMPANGIVPNAFSYTVLIQGLYRCNKLEDAVEFCVEMLEAGHSPNVVTFVGLVDALCRDKGLEEAQAAVRRFQEKGFLVNDKSVREYMDKKALFSSSVWEAIFGKRVPNKPF